VPLEFPPPVPVAGFARLSWAEKGRRDPVSARALALRERGCTIVLVSVEILLVPGELDRAVTRAVRDLELDHIVLAATHTHAEPGGYWDNLLGARFATGPYRKATFDHLVEQIARAVRMAVAALEPASLSAGRLEAPEFARNRAGGGEVDGRLVSFRLDSLAGKTMANVLIYPAHATLLGIQNRLVSGDWPGALMRSQPAPWLLFQGAVGDQAPLMPAGQRPDPELYAQALLRKLGHLRRSPPEARPALAVATSSVVLPPICPGATPPLLRRLAMNLLHDVLPPRASVSAIRLGPFTLITVPGEPVAAVGRGLRDAVGPQGEILALAGDYLGYVETGERYATGTGETALTYYGPELFDRLARAVKLAADAVRDPATSASGTNREFVPARTD